MSLLCSGLPAYNTMVVQAGNGKKQRNCKQVGRTAVRRSLSPPAPCKPPLCCQTRPRRSRPRRSPCPGSRTCSRAPCKPSRAGASCRARRPCSTKTCCPHWAYWSWTLPTGGHICDCGPACIANTIYLLHHERITEGHENEGSAT